MKTIRAKCDGCGKDKSLSTCSGDLLCSTCAALAGSVSNRPEVVATLVARRGQAEKIISQLVAEKGREWLMQTVQQHLPENVAVKVENATLDQIAKVVGYSGESAEGLIEAVRTKCELIDEYRKKVEQQHDVIGSKDVTIEELKQRLLNVREEELRLLLGLDPEDPVLEYIESVLMPQYRDRELVLEKIKTALGVDHPQQAVEAIGMLTSAFDKYRSQCERLASKNSVVANQLADAQLRIADLETACSVHQDRIAVLESGTLLSCEIAQKSSGIDTLLLDLALDAMRGQITGLDPDRIAVIREAA